jgi:UDP-N-acetyl-alpha-D-quinovosamine dehydrogenase
VKSVLITGAEGFVGRQLAPSMLDAGVPVVAVVRQHRLEEPAGVNTVCVGDLRERRDWHAILASVDAVIHLAARAHVITERASNPLDAFRETNVEPTLNLFRACQTVGVKRFVFVSTIGVNGVETQHKPFQDGDVPNPTEPYAISKWEAEQTLGALAAHGATELVIVRPTLIYGPWAKGNFLRLMRLVKSGWPLPIASVSATRSILSLTDFCDLLIRCTYHEAAAGQIFLAADRKPIPTRDLIVTIADLMKRRARLVRLAPRILTLVGHLSGFGAEIDRLTASLEVDSSRARKLLDWNGDANFERDMKRMVDKFLGGRDVCR